MNRNLNQNLPKSILLRGIESGPRDLLATRYSDAKEMIVLIDPEPDLIGAFRNGAPFDLKDLGRDAVLTIKRSAVQSACESLGREPDMHQL